MKQITVVALANLPGLPRGTVTTVDETPQVLALIRKGRLRVTVVQTKDEQPPRGTISEVMRWVGDDHDRAYAALDVELQTGAPRQGLVRRIDTLLGVTGSPQSDDDEPGGPDPDGAAHDAYGAPEGSA